MLAPTVALVPLVKMFQSMGLYNTFWALLILYTAFRIPFTTFLIRAYMIDLPREVDEAAEVDGASRWTAFWRVILPLALPGVIAGSIFTFSLTLGDFIVPSALGNSSYFIGQAVLAHQGTSGNIPLAAAFTMVPITIMAIYLLVARRLGAFDAL